MVASFFPEYRLWGFNQYAFLGIWGRISLSIITIASLLMFAYFNAKPIQSIPLPNKWIKPLTINISLLAILLCLFVLFRAKTHFLGDGYLLLSRLENQSIPIRPWNRGIYLILDIIYNLLGKNGQSDALLSFQLVSWGSGIGLLGATIIATKHLFQKFSQRSIFIIGIMSAGYSLLFFGYVENYPVLILTVGTFCLLGLLSVKSYCSSAWCFIPLLVGIWFHPYGVAFIPAAIYLLISRTNIFEKMNHMLHRSAWCLSLVLMALGIFLAHLLSLNYLFLQFALVPLVENRFTVDGYSLVSVPHLLDIGNLLLLLLPPIPLFIIIIFTKKNKSNLSDYGSIFLLISSFGALLILFLFDPKLGMPRDWDMFSFAGVPIAALMYWLLLCGSPPNKDSIKLAMACIVVSLMVLVPRVITQLVPKLGVTLADSYHMLDVKKNRVGRTLVVSYFDKLGNKDEVQRRNAINKDLAEYEELHYQAHTLSEKELWLEAIKKYQRVVKIDPSYSASWTNMGACFSALGEQDSALFYLQIADGINPFNSVVYNNLGAVYDALGDILAAEGYWREALWLDSSNILAYRNLLSVYSRQRNQDEYSKLAHHVAYMNGSTSEDIKTYADFLSAIGKRKKAIEQYRRAIKAGLDTNIRQNLEYKYPELKIIE